MYCLLFVRPVIPCSRLAFAKFDNLLVKEILCGIYDKRLLHDMTHKLTKVTKYVIKIGKKKSNIDYSIGTSAHAKNRRGFLEEVLKMTFKMLNCGTVCQFWSIFHTKSDTN